MGQQKNNIFQHNNDFIEFASAVGKEIYRCINDEKILELTFAALGQAREIYPTFHLNRPQVALLARSMLSTASGYEAILELFNDNIPHSPPIINSHYVQQAAMNNETEKALTMFNQYYAERRKTLGSIPLIAQLMKIGDNTALRNVYNKNVEIHGEVSALLDSAHGHIEVGNMEKARKRLDEKEILSRKFCLILDNYPDKITLARPEELDECLKSPLVL